MAAISNYLEEKWLNTMRGVDYTAPTKVYVALFTTEPNDTLQGTEPVGSSYSRQVVTFDEPQQVDDKCTIRNANEIIFVAATEAWGTIGYIGIFDAETAGNMLWQGAVNTAKTVDVDDQVRFQINELVITLE